MSNPPDKNWVKSVTLFPEARSQAEQLLVLAQPANVSRFALAGLNWEGGDPKKVTVSELLRLIAEHPNHLVIFPGGNAVDRKDVVDPAVPDDTLQLLKLLHAFATGKPKDANAMDLVLDARVGTLHELARYYQRITAFVNPQGATPATTFDEQKQEQEKTQTALAFLQKTDPLHSTPGELHVQGFLKTFAAMRWEIPERINQLAVAIQSIGETIRREREAAVRPPL